LKIFEKKHILVSVDTSMAPTANASVK
jgi:hypothetical protein